MPGRGKARSQKVFALKTTLPYYYRNVSGLQRNMTPDSYAERQETGAIFYLILDMVQFHMLIWFDQRSEF